MPTTQTHTALFNDTIATLAAGAMGLISMIFDGTGPFLDREGSRIIAALTIITLVLLAIRHWMAIRSNRP